MILTKISGVIFVIANIILIIALVLTFLRAILGPRIVHRVVALDLMANVIIGLVACYALWRQQPLYLNLIIGLALVVFLGTVAYAQYIESRAAGSESYDRVDS